MESSAGKRMIGEGMEEKNSVPLPFDERNQWLETMADSEVRNDARYDSLKLRIARLEKRAALLTMNEEMKTFLVMTGISIAAAVLVPLVQAMVEKWRRSQS